MKRSLFPIVIILFINCLCQAQEQSARDSLPDYGQGHKSSSMFRTFYHTGNLVHYLDNIDDLITYQTETTGDFNLPDQLTFSIMGNSFRQNKYYIDGFRTDSRFFVGSTLYLPDMTSHSLDIDYFNSALRFTTDSAVPNSVAASYNIGGVGGISKGTTEFVNLLHLTATQREYKPIELRSKMNGAGTLRMDYAIPIKGKRYLQQVYFDYGQRGVASYDEGGINGLYPEDFFKLNLKGQLPIEGRKLFDRWNYLFHASGRDNLYSEYYYGKDETAKSGAYSLSVYGNKENGSMNYTSGLTLAVNSINHNDISFMRNLIDQDGEGFEPWYPDGTFTEVSYALNLNKRLNDLLYFEFDGYNSLMNFASGSTQFGNAVYMRKTKEAFHSLYRYEWNSRSFWSGLLENTARVGLRKQLNSWLLVRANLDVTFDAMILSEKSMFRPNWQAKAGIDIHPCRWFEMQVNLARSRVAYNWDYIKFFSDKYLNGDIYYWQDSNQDQRYQPGEKGSYLTSTGGKYHGKVKNLRQPSYFILDIPVYFRFGRHEFAFLNSFKKYFDTWWTQFDGDAEQYGYYNNDNNQPIFFFNGRQPTYYTVGYFPRSDMETGKWTDFISNSPYYFSSVMKYQYTGRKFFFSLSWQSYLMAGASPLGNGPLHNDINTLSESTANPNVRHKLIGRYDQDKAFIARMQIAYNITKNFSLQLTGKWKDGQPFSNYKDRLVTDAAGNSQLAIWRGRTKGINPLDGNFGSREDAFYYFDLRATYRGTIRKRIPFEIQAYCYNIYDFGTELNEYTFLPIDADNYVSDRLAMSLNIPRGLMLSVKFGLP